MNEEIVDQLEEQTQVSAEAVEEKPKTTWLMFSIAGKK
jgi:hypothetical protein